MFVGRHGRGHTAAVVLVFSSLLAGLGSEAKAAAATGYANATVIGEILSLPLVIRMRTAGVDSSAAAAPPTTNLPAPVTGPSLGMTLIDMDASGAAAFSVGGAATTSYVIGPAAAEESSAPAPTVGSPATPDRTAGGLILPREAVTDGAGLSIIISQAAMRTAGELRVMVNYN
jgi:hypothetical protein